MKNKPMLAAAILVSVGVVIGVAIVSLFDTNSWSSLYAQAKQVTELGAKQAPVKVESSLQILNNGFIAVSKAVNPTVVSINVVTEKKVSKDQRKFQDFFGFRMPGQPDGEDGGEGDGGDGTFRSQGAGSGVFITADGYIMTNNHVVEDAKKSGGIKVVTADKHEYDAKLVGRDELTDIAVIKVEPRAGESFTPAFLANSDEVRVGEWVVAVGNPLGLNSTITAGIVSAISRGRLGLSRDARSVENYIQTDAAINPGNSGGGLFDLEGKLIGINTAIATRTGGFQGYGFAIPVNLAKAVAADLMDDGKINRGYIGVNITPVDEATAKAVGLSKVTGAMVQGFSEKSAGKDAGMQEGDVILEVDGVEVGSSNELQSRIGMRRAGDKVNLTIWRDKQKLTKTVTLRAPDADKNDKLASNVTPSETKTDESVNKPVTLDNLGLTVEQLDTKTKDDLDVKNGVKVGKVEQFGPVFSTLAPGSVITKVAGQAVTSPKQFKELMATKKPGEAVLLQVKFKGGSRFVGIEIPRKDAN